MRKGKVSHWQIINKKLWKLILKNKNKMKNFRFPILENLKEKLQKMISKLMNVYKMNLVLKINLSLILKK